MAEMAERHKAAAQGGGDDGDGGNGGGTQGQEQRLEAHQEAPQQGRRQQIDANGGEGEEEQERPSLSATLYNAMYYVMLFFAAQSLLGPALQMMLKPQHDASPSSPATASQSKHTHSRRNVPTGLHNVFSYETPLSLAVYVSEYGPRFSDFKNSSLLVWTQDSFINYGDWDAPLSHKVVDVRTTPSLRANGSLFVHAYVHKPGAALDPSDPEYDTGSVAELHTNIIHYKPRKAAQHRRKLLDSSATESALPPGPDSPGAADGAIAKGSQKATAGQSASHQDVGGSGDDTKEGTELATLANAVVAHWHGNLTLQLLTDDQPYHPNQMLPALNQRIKILSESQEYVPVLFRNDFWDLRENMHEINASTASLPLNITLGPVSVNKLSILLSMDESLRQQRALGTAAEAEQEMMKKMLLETNPYYLGLTMAVSLLHTVFDWMAFKNDIQFWRDRKSMEGLSLRALLTSLVFQAIIFLYLCDHEETSWLILASAGVGVAIQAWKITRAADVTVSYERRVLGIFPRISIRGKADYRSTTEQYDQLAFKYLSWVMGPLFAGYAVYSLLYNEHKGWYSYTVNMLAGAVYTFGFIQMTPQLFINYKLKSVAHMPWRFMTYKFLNTIVDDLFAFVISMPTMHRLACFRDDIVFMVFLYQRWAYRVDPSRRNEYGVKASNEEATEKQGEQTTATDPEEPAATAGQAKAEAPGSGLEERRVHTEDDARSGDTVSSGESAQPTGLKRRKRTTQATDTPRD